MGVVVDSSAALDLLLRTENERRVAPTLLASDADLHAPAVLDAEVLIVLRRAELRGEIGAQRASEALDDLRDLRVVLHMNRPLIQRAWELRANMTAPDAIYVALAESLGASLLTTDAPLFDAVRTHTSVEPIEAQPSSGPG